MKVQPFRRFDADPGTQDQAHSLALDMLRESPGCYLLVVPGKENGTIDFIHNSTLSFLAGVYNELGGVIDDGIIAALRHMIAEADDE